MKEIIRALPIVFSLFTCLRGPVVLHNQRRIARRRRTAFSEGNVCALQPVARGPNVRDKVCVESDAQGKFVINLSQAHVFSLL
jgi:hypothetical protein